MSRSDYRTVQRLLAPRDGRDRPLRLTLRARPVLRLADELPQLRKHRLRVRPLALERLDSIEPVEHSARLVHLWSVRGRCNSGVSGGSAKRERACRTRAEAEDRLVETRDEGDAVIVHQHLDERPPDGVRTGSFGAEVRQELSWLARGLAQQYGGTHGSGPHPVRPAEQSDERAAQLVVPERRVLEARELPAVERVRELRVCVREREAGPQLRGELRAEGIEPRRLAGRLRRGDRQHRPNPKRPPVEPLEEHGTGRDRPGCGETQRRHRVGKLPRRVGRLGPPAREVALELEDAEAVGLAAEVWGQETLRLRPVCGELTRYRVPHADPVAELDRRREGDADERRDGAERVARAEEGALELAVGAIEREVVPVEAAARLRRRDEQRQEHRPEERLVFRSTRPRVGAREDPRRGLAPELLEAEPRVFAAHQHAAARLEEAADEGSVLVQRRPAERDMLLERKRELLVHEEREGAEAEATQGAAQVRIARSHGPRHYGAAGSSPFWHVGHQ